MLKRRIVMLAAASGHIPDCYINFGSQTPKQVSLPRCG
jgi:hypothetical protein